MKILTIVSDFGLRGTQRVAQNFSIALSRMGHQVAVLPFEGSGSRKANYLAAGVKILEPVATGQSGISEAQKFAPDVVHIHRSGVPVRRETEVLSQLRSCARCVIETNVFARFDPEADEFIDVHGQITRMGLYRWNRLSDGRTRGIGIYLPNAVDFAPFDAPNVEAVARLRSELHQPNGNGIVFGRIGNNDRRFVRLLPSLFDRLPKSVLASVSDPELDPMLQALPPKYSERVRILKPTNDDAVLATYYGAFDALLHWSKVGESFGMVLAESVAAGTPVIMPLQPHRELGGLEVVGHKEGGLIAGSPASLVDAAVELVQDREHYAQGLARARARLHSEYHSDVVAAHLVRVAETWNEADRCDAHRAFQSDPSFVTRIDRDFVRKILSAHHGSRSPFEMLLHHASHHAIISGIPRAIRTHLRPANVTP
jgi:glycosyltransferase involved in cell wall biosynthesis